MTGRSGFPAALKDMSRRDSPSTEIYTEVDGPTKIISYVKKGKVKTSAAGKETSKPSKLVTMLTTLEPFAGKKLNYEIDKYCTIN